VRAGRDLQAWMAYRAPAYAWTAFILWAAGPSFSSDRTGPVLLWLIHSIFGELDPQDFATIHFLVRKSAHVVEYAILGLLWFRAARQGAPRAWRAKWAAVALAVAMATATGDEIRQGRSARTSSAGDVALDMAGAAAGLALLRVRRRIESDGSAQLQSRER
jgi:VanZ family protein